MITSFQHAELIANAFGGYIELEYDSDAVRDFRVTIHLKDDEYRFDSSARPFNESMSRFLLDFDRFVDKRVEEMKMRMLEIERVHEGDLGGEK